MHCSSFHYKIFPIVWICIYIFFCSIYPRCIKDIVSFWIVLVCADLECTSLQAVSLCDNEDVFDLYLRICKYLLSVIIAYTTASSNNLSNHDYMGHIGGIARAFTNSNDILFKAGHIMLNVGNKYTNWFSQLIDTASINNTSGSDIQEAYLLAHELEAKKIGIPLWRVDKIWYRFSVTSGCLLSRKVSELVAFDQKLRTIVGTTWKWVLSIFLYKKECYKQLDRKM